MDIRKYLGKIFMLIIVTISCISISSCSKDDGDSVRDQLVGVWKTSMTSSSWRTIELESNGVLHYSMKIDEDGNISYSSFEGTNNAHWSFNDQDQTISMYTSDGYYTYTYKVNMASDGNSWAGYTSDKNGKTTTFSFTRIR